MVIDRGQRRFHKIMKIYSKKTFIAYSSKPVNTGIDLNNIRLNYEKTLKNLVRITEIDIY